MEEGFYQQIITDEINAEINKINSPILSTEAFSKEDGAIYLNRFFQNIFKQAFDKISVSSEEIAKPRLIELSNKVINLVSDYCDQVDLLDSQIDKKGRILKAFFLKENYKQVDLNDHIKEVFPFSGLSESELFTGSKSGISLESELKKEMLSSDEVWWLVSFLKFEGVRLFEQVFKRLQELGKPVKIICTVYMGATDLKAIDFLSQFSNVEIKISFNSNQERLHAKSYLFIRNSGFHTGYIGSSNLSRSALTNGLEWNLKITQQEIPHIIQKCQNTFQTYWEDAEFIRYDSSIHRDKLKNALINGNNKTDYDETIFAFFDVTPYPFNKRF